MTELSQGANAAVTGQSVSVSIDWSVVPGVDADITAYLLTDAGKVRGDADMIFYNNPAGGDGAITYAAGSSPRGRFDVDLTKLPAAVTRIVFCVTIEEAVARRQTMARLSGARIAAGDLVFAPNLDGAAEAAMTLGELYLRNGAWKFRAVGQGFNGGLAPLARSFGIDVADEVPPPPATAAPVAAAPTPPPAAKPISLGKISLEKPSQSISLEKRGTTFGEIVVNLNWSRGASKRGFFGGGSGAIDLDLGCLLELRDGTKGAVQALGRMFGSYDRAPFIALSGDDRTGDVSSGETMRINGAHWTAIKRIAIFANIYEGAPNWSQTDGVVTVTMPDQPRVEVRMTEGRNDKRLCGVVLLENDRGSLKVTRIVDYFRDQSELDRKFGWGMRWAAGRK